MVEKQRRDDHSLSSELVLVFEGNDVSIFDSSEQAVFALEPLDVRAGIYVVFRADGSPGRMTVSPSPDPQRGQIQLRFGSSDTSSRLELSRRIESCLAAIGQPHDVNANDLEVAVSKLQDYFGKNR